MKRLIQHVHGHAKRHYDTHYRTHYKERAHLVFLLDAILVGTAVGLLAVGVYFAKFYHPLRDDFRLNVATVGDVVGAQEGEIAVFVENVGDDALIGGRLTVHLPDVFLAADGRTGSREIEIGLLPAGTSAEYRFRGMPMGAPRTAKAVAHFEARGEDGRRDERLVAGDLKWEKSLIEARFEAPESVIPGQAIRFRIEVKNGADFPIGNAALNVKWPDGFRLVNATPPVYRDAVALGDLEAGETAYVDVAGRLTAAVDLQKLKAELLGTVGERRMSLYEATADIGLADAGLELSAAFASEAHAFARPGEEMPVVVRYRNDGAAPLTELALGIAPDPRVIASVRWEESADIGALASGESGERMAYVRLLDPVSRYVTNPFLRVTPTARFSVASPKVDGAEIAGTAVERKVAGAARLRAAARYYTSEGDQIGRGPLPPKAGSATRYWIFASLETGASRIDGGMVRFALPNGVAFTGRAAATVGEDAFLEGGNLLWRVGSVEAHAGALYEAPSISFEVALTPSAAQVGTTPFLVSSAAFAGTDAWTGAELASTSPGLTTQLTGDPEVGGRTVVRP